VAAAVFGLIAAACGAADGDPDRTGVGEGATRPLVLGDPGEIPPVLTEPAAVPLDEVVFDTFDGGSVDLAEVDASTVERLLDAIPPLDAPDYEGAGTADGWLDDADLVVGYVDDDGVPWAYPTRVLDRHEIVNDELAGRPVLVSWCPLCGSGVVYDRRVGSTVRSFSNTSALHENDLVMVDRETGTYWWQVAGRAIVGRDTGAELSPLASVTTTWGRWREEHPDTAVLARPGGRPYGPSRLEGYDDRVDAGETPFPVSETALGDERLPASARVLVVDGPSGPRAWPVAPAGRVRDRVGRRPVEVVTDGRGGQVLDAATSEALPTRTAMWFAIVAAFPDVDLRLGAR
jgi:hypothetical protein